MLFVVDRHRARQVTGVTFPGAGVIGAFRARLIDAALGLAPDEPDQVLRLGRFREEHAGVIIGDGGFGTWQARIPESNGETVITRYTLRELLDKLGELMAGRGGESTRAAVDAPVAARPEQGRNSSEAIAQRRGSRGA
jgi:hypothetical protein